MGWLLLITIRHQFSNFQLQSSNIDLGFLLCKMSSFLSEDMSISVEVCQEVFYIKNAPFDGIYYKGWNDKILVIWGS